MSAYQAADRSAFERLYAILRPELLRYLGSLAGEPDWAADLVQETFLQIHRARATYEPGRPVRPWVYAIARNVFMMHRRKRARAMRAETEAVVGASEIAAESNGILNRRMLAQGLATLDAGHREPVRLRYLEDLDFAQISAHLGMTAGAARVRVSRALAALRRHLR
jgi:RNA polymerase sigma-70 factor (ECF subfamily)